MTKTLVFLTMPRIVDIAHRGIYTDLLRKFRDEGWVIYIVTPRERSILKTSWLKVICGRKHGAQLEGRGDVHYLHVNTLNLQKTSTIEKGIGQVLMEKQYTRAIKKYLSDVKFDLILYSTPPITFSKVISYLKNRNPRAISYLLLKDIFPQNALDIGILSKHGASALLYRFFRNKEKHLYKISDYIGCMSDANVEYVRRHNPEIVQDRIEVAPNSIEVVPEFITSEESRAQKLIERDLTRDKHHLPKSIPIFIYGGNLGKPQGIPYLINCLDANSARDDCHFLIIGSGTEYPRLKAWYLHNMPKSVSVKEGLPRKEYDELVSACDVGMIFLDHRFTIPNYPSRLLNYLENRMPVICATDPNTDIGRIAETNGYGFWCESNSVQAFSDIVDRMIHSDRCAMGEKGYEFFKKNYLIDNTYNAIMSHV